MDTSSGPSSPASGLRLPASSRHSLEIFNPSAATFRPTTPSPTWQNWNAPRGSPKPDPVPTSPELITSWMAFQEPENLPADAAAQRAAEWGLVLKTDTDTGKLKGVTARTSGGDETYNNRGGASRRNSNTSVRSSGELSDGGGKDKGLPRVSQDLKDALSAFQQTFVVSDATAPDHPILYASAGFFKMTGYSSKEVIGKNCRFLQGPETKAEDVAKIREALKEGRNYCGRLLNYKKDGTAFWNLLTISPIKDENGVVLKFIGMQVDTEGYTDNSIRPNGLPESLIRYDGRQKDLARNSVSELVDAVQKPNALIESINQRPSNKKSDKGKALAEKDFEELVTNVPPNPNNPRPRERSSHGSSRRNSMYCITEASDKNPIHKNEPNDKKQRKSSRFSLTRLVKRNSKKSKDNVETKDKNGGVEDDDNEDVESSEEETVKTKEMRKGMDLATTLERIEKNFVITDPRLPDNPIIFASDSFLELTEYSREEILGRNCRFLQGPETDPATVRKIREAIDNQTDVTVQLINYTKSGKKFWNLFHLQAMRDQKGEVQYFIGVQLDGSENVEPLHNCIPEETAKEDEKLVKATAENVDEAARELPDANSTPEDLWMNHSKTVHPKPHRKNSPSWRAIQKILDSGEQVGLKHFKSIKPLGTGDTGSVHLVELCGSGLLFAMKAMDKSVMLNRNKVHRVCAEREILDKLDHPFLPALYASFQTKTHICLIIDYCPGGELFLLLDRQPKKVLKEDAVRFYAAEVVVALEYLHYHGIIYRDLKPENILLQSNGHVSLTDFDLSCLTSCKPQILIPTTTDSKKQHKGQQKHQQTPIFMAEPMRASNSFVGTEEYIAPEIVTGAGHTSAVDWWALGALLYEMFYGYTPFRGKTRQKTFANIIHKDLRFPRNKLASVSLHAKELMYQLLEKDPNDRLGSRQGANEIKSHPFFQGINWALVRCTDPPELDVPLSMMNEEKESELEPLELHNNVF